MSDDDWKTRPLNLSDPDNPEWTHEDVALATPVRDLPPDMLKAILASFPHTPVPEGRTRDGGYTAQDVPLDADVVEHFRRKGGDWKARVNEALRSLVTAR